MAKTCIVCGGPAGSGEHIFPACTGGRRINNGIYCEKHNNAYGDLAALLGNQLAFANAQFGIRNTRTKQIKPVEMTDAASGAKYEFDGTSLKPIGPRIISQTGSEATIAMPNDPAVVKRFVEAMEAKGIQLQAATGQPQSYHPGQLSIQLSFGGPEGLRAIGYLAQTFLAHCYPDLARNPAMKAFIDYTLNGAGSHLVWWDFEAPADLTPNFFEFGHRIIVGADRDNGVVYGRVSLFSTFDYAMIFYNMSSLPISCSVINDIDPMAIKMPDDLKQHVVNDKAAGTVIRPEDTSQSLRAAINNGTARDRQEQLMRRVTDYRRRCVAEDLLGRIASAADMASKERVVVEFWNGESQRVLRLLGATVEYLTADPKPSDPGWTLLVRRLQAATERDEGTPSGLTPRAEAAIKIAADGLCHAMIEEIRSNALDQDRAEMFIEGGLGQHAASNAVFNAGLVS